MRISDWSSDVCSSDLLAVLENAVVAPIVAFFTFIGSMGNVPLAAMLWSKGNSFGGATAFLGADLVAATVIWIHATYRSEERRVGQECGSTCRSRGSHCN